jgi:RNA polymerase sigma factor (sigma-70 family)
MGAGSATVGLESARSFEEFFDTESRVLFRRLWLVTGNRAEAEEIMQDAFLALWERWDRVSRLDDPTGYLYRTAMNLFRKRYRRAVLAARRTVRPDLRRDDFEEADDRAVVRRTLAELSPRQRAALVLTEMLSFTSEEAGAILGVRAGTVRALASQGRAAFRRQLEADDA